MNPSCNIRGQVCPNPKCQFYKKTGQGNVTIHSQKNQRFQCSECQKTWKGNINTPYYGLRSDREKIEQALNLLAAGKSVRKVAKEVSVSPSTVQRWKAKFCQTIST